MRRSLSALVILTAGAVVAAPKTYEIDPGHTYPSFEADHFGGMSVWRGKFDKSSGTIDIDREAGTGTVQITVDLSSVNTGHEDLDKHLRAKDFFEVERFPTATYKGRLTDFKDGAPRKIEGELTLHGVTRPVALTIRSFKCMQHPMLKKEFCGADAETTIDRSEFGIAWGKDMGFDMKTKLAIQVEAFPK